MQISIPFLGNISLPSIRSLTKIQGREIHYFPGERFLFGMGCKLFRFLPYLQYYQDEISKFTKNQSTSKIVFAIHGGLHSNYLASFSYFTYLWNIPCYTIAYTWDKKKVTANSFFVSKYSNHLDIVTPKVHRRIFENLKSVKVPSSSLFVSIQIGNDGKFLHWLPEFGMSEPVLSYMTQVWNEIPILNYKNVVVDIGSGVTAISLFRYLQSSNTHLWGVALGEKSKDWKINNKHYLEDSLIFDGLGQTKNSNSNFTILESSIDKGYSKASFRLKTFINDNFQFRIPLEPIYSAKSLFTMEENIDSFPQKEPILYIHQGGLLNWTSLFKASSKIKTR